MSVGAQTSHGHAVAVGGARRGSEGAVDLPADLREADGRVEEGVCGMLEGPAEAVAAVRGV